jgi:hypothetical protein
MSYTVEVQAPLYLGGVALPLYAELVDTTEPNLSKNISLDGTLNIDFYNNRRKWTIKWNYLTAAEHDTIRALYDNQFLSSTLPTFWITSVNLAVPVFINIVDKNIKWNGQLIEGFQITLEEGYGIS